MPRKKVKPVKRIVMRSGFEKKIASYLKDNEVVYEYEPFAIKYVVPSKKKSYTPDFRLPNGVIVEGKGKFDHEAREKMALVIEQHPELDIRMLFMRNNYINKKSKTRYSDWCDKRGIKWAVSQNGHIPVEWLESSQGE